ncbi:TIGR02453 family protein [Pedobacter sp. HMF7647]|uniref:TIGR02453 family protein n=1 Tax=Hufsiella arboris TaxID=2695275 RepID=A0A7K1Y5T4_9SPHI|nr:DUF2461 domain-containing protein [Hufsiella arboris]MXV49388.1 TIGR02453 family protein [Hufsiella arboris]
MISKSTFEFLRLLAENNNREWFAENKPSYEDAKQNVEDFASSLIRVLSKIDPVIPADLDPAKSVFRIYRDIRFSKDKTPYKNNFGIGISPKGKSFDGASYYIQVQPGNSFIAAGDWQPPTDRLKAIRQEIDYNGSDFDEIINKPLFKKYYGTLSTEDKLKTMPKGYPVDHSHIEFLKLKSFIVLHEIKEEMFQNKKFEQHLSSVFESVQPFMLFLHNATA